MAPERSSGVLLHLTSLPGPYGIGDLGEAAFRFADLLAASGQRYWQMLPIVPVGHGYSPYSSPSTFAGNPLLISPDRLRERGLLKAADLADLPDFPEDHVDFEPVIAFRTGLLTTAFERFEEGRGGVSEDRFELFCSEHAYWLDDYALFAVLKEQFDETPWTSWPRELAARRPDALAKARERHARDLRRQRFWQYLFFEQWSALRSYCHMLDVQLFGDLPIYVAHDSADVWANPDLFHLDERGEPTVVAGVPPDYFSETGQRWGNPLYDWEVMRENGYNWWTHRISHTLHLVDVVRLDHFRGFAGYWEIPATEETAVNGQWRDGPGSHLFQTFQERLGRLPLVAEDLGLITEDVTELMAEFELPGMAVLQFAFGGDSKNPYLPHNHRRRLVVYTGTHDNDTTMGWWREAAAEAPAGVREHVLRYLGLPGDAEPDHWTFIRLALASVATMAIIPVQDILGLGDEARMNTPGMAHGNWGWRLRPDQLNPAAFETLRKLAQLYGRSVA